MIATEMRNVANWTFDVPCRREAVPSMQETLRHVLAARSIPASRIHDALIVAEELLVNVIGHAMRTASTPRIRLHLALEEHEIVLGFLDDGPAFDPLKLPEPELNTGIGKRQIGGLGVYLVRQLANACHYVYSERTNVLVVRLGREMRVNSRY